MESGEKDTKSAVDQQRRRLTKAAAVSPIVASLISRPVWGTTCSISGLQSGNLSGTAKTQCEGSGCTPGFWKNAPEAWLMNTIYSPGHCTCFNKGNGLCQEWNGGSGTKFVDVFGIAPGAGFPTDASMMDILLNQHGGDANDLFHFIAALLNANAAPNTFGATTEQVITAVKAAMTDQLFDDMGNHIENGRAKLKEVLADMNEAGAQYGHCIYNNAGACKVDEVADGDRCIKACTKGYVYDMCSGECQPEGTSGIVTIAEMLSGEKTLDNCGQTSGAGSGWTGKRKKGW